MKSREGFEGLIDCAVRLAPRRPHKRRDRRTDTSAKHALRAVSHQDPAPGTPRAAGAGAEEGGGMRRLRDRPLHRWPHPQVLNDIRCCLRPSGELP